MEYKPTFRLWFWVAIALLATTPLFAIETEIYSEDEAVPTEPTPLVSSIEGPWSQHRYGFYVGTLGDPAPSLASINFGYHPNDYVRLHAGIGYIPLFVDNATTFGGGVLVRALGKSTVSPVFGVSAAAVRVRFDHLSGILDSLFPKGSFKPWDDTLYVGTGKVGIDWQSQAGFNVGAGLQILVAKLTIPLPYLHLGWFF